MRRQSLSPEDRKVFDAWAIAVSAIYSLLAAGVLAVTIGASHMADTQNASRPDIGAVVARSPGSQGQR